MKHIPPLSFDVSRRFLLAEKITFILADHLHFALHSFPFKRVRKWVHHEGAFSMDEEDHLLDCCDYSGDSHFSIVLDSRVLCRCSWKNTFPPSISSMYLAVFFIAFEGWLSPVQKP
ncbi:hypothetical protein Droror1_Dr00022684 [Drosera rotundifolia]